METPGQPAARLRARCRQAARRIVAGGAAARAGNGSTRSRSTGSSRLRIPVAPVTLAETPDEAAAAARPILAEGGTVAVKILSPDIVHKSDIGGVKLDLTTEEAVRKRHDATSSIAPSG